MKKMITAVAALLMSAATFAQTATATKAAAAPARVEAQGPRQRKPVTPEDRAKRETEQMNSLVPLGAAYDKVLAVNTTYAAKRMETRGTMNKGKEMTKEEADAQRAKMQSQMKEINQAHKKDLQTAMGADLFAKYEAAMKAKREERRQMRQQAAPAPGQK